MKLRSISILTFVVFWVSIASAGNLIVNGGFESGSLAGWSEFDQSGGSGSWFADNNTFTPLSLMPTVGPASGSWYAVTDQLGPGSHALIQSFTVGGGTQTLSFDMFVNNWSAFVDCTGLDYTVGSTQCGRVDILTANASPFDTGAGVVQNLYMGADSGANPNPYTHYNFTLSLPIGTYQLRFAEADNLFYFNMGIDNVVLTSSVPEPGSMALLGSAVLGVAGLVHRKFLL